MRILILGATGKIGRLAVKEAQARGHQVTALVRNSSKHIGEGVRLIKGNVLDGAALATAVEGQDAVLYTIGRSDHFTETTLFSDSTRLLVRAMKNADVRRLICVTGIGAGDSRGHGGFIYDRLVFPLILKRTYADKDRQEELVRENGLDWTIVRPGGFKSGPARRRLREYTNLQGVTVGMISRADVAAFAIGQIEDRRYAGTAVTISDG